MNLPRPNAIKTCEEVCKRVSSKRLAVVQEPLYDYGKIYRSCEAYPIARPRNKTQLQKLVTRAYTEQVAVRVRGSGHTFSGASLPEAGELLIRTDQLNHFRFEEPGTVTVGSGALVWDVRDHVADAGYQMPVYNGGWAGPTIGGYINAGGFGKSGLSEVYGGFWENVQTVTFIDGTGNVQSIDEEDERFPWLFGSFGQFGVLLEAKIKIVPTPSKHRHTYPQGSFGRILFRQEDDPRVNDLPPATGVHSSLFWFSLLVSPDQEQQAWHELEQLVHTYRGLLVPDGGWAGPVIDGEPIGYRYCIRFHRFNPPLLFPKPETFLVLGVMSQLKSGAQASNRRLLELEASFVKSALQNDFCLYLQAENIGTRVNLQDYYGATTYRRWHELKHEFDPAGIINPGRLDTK